MKSLLQLVDAVLHDMESMCHVSATRDFKTISSRFENEGMAFLTITLPDFGKDFERSLDQGKVSSSEFHGFVRSGELPRFLGGFLELVFDRVTGVLLDSPNIEAIRAIRQLTLMFAKIKLKTTPERDRLAIEGYIKCENDLVSNLQGVPGLLLECFDLVATVLNRDLISSVSNDISTNQIFTRHSNGSTADRKLGNTKWQSKQYTHRLEEHFPIYSVLAYNGLDALRIYDEFEFIEPGDELPVKVTLVPKTQKSPRIIAMEPSYVQFVQQGLLHSFATHIKKVDYLRSMVSLDDQLPNREFARRGSSDGSLATLDLSEASDRVSLATVERMFSKNPVFLEALKACRSTSAELPDGTVMFLKKFASMGSAMCFPIEALCFFSVIVASIVASDIRVGKLHGLDIRSVEAVIKRLQHSVRVFGDDIIIPSANVTDVIGGLEAFGLKINYRKSFWNGKFRESCGGDYYDGEWVTPFRCRNLLPDNIKDTEQMVSTVSLRNQAYKAGFWRTVKFLDKWVEAIAPFPAVEDTSGHLGKHTFLPVTGSRECKKLHRPQVKAMSLKTSPRRSDLRDDGHASLRKWFGAIRLSPDSNESGPVFLDKDHLLYSGRPDSARISIRWVYTY